MHLLPLLLLLAGARVEGGQEADRFEELQVVQKQKGENQQEKKNLQETKLVNRDKIKDANCSQLLNSFSESSSNFTRCPGLLQFWLIFYHWLGVQTSMHSQSSCVATALTTIWLSSRFMRLLSTGNHYFLQSHFVFWTIFELLKLASAEEEISCKDLLTSRDKVELIKATVVYITIGLNYIHYLHYL